MTVKQLAATLASLAAIIGGAAQGCSVFTDNYSIEIELHLVPIWGENEELPERLR